MKYPISNLLTVLHIPAAAAFRPEQPLTHKTGLRHKRQTGFTNLWAPDNHKWIESDKSKVFWLSSLHFSLAAKILREGQGVILTLCKGEEISLLNPPFKSEILFKYFKWQTWTEHYSDSELSWGKCQSHPTGCWKSSHQIHMIMNMQVHMIIYYGCTVV